MNYLHKLHDFLDGDIFFCEIGAMDGKRHDDMHRYIKRYNWKGLLVEPLRDMFERLKDTYSDKKGIAFENAAVSDTDSHAKIYRVPIDIIKAHRLPGWVDGISSLYANRNEISHYSKFAVRETVRTTTFDTLVKKHHISRIDVLQIDTEGHDYAIFQQIFPRFTPYMIKVEYKHLLRNEKDEIKTILQKHGYKVITKDGDFIATMKLKV